MIVMGDSTATDHGREDYQAMEPRSSETVAVNAPSQEGIVSSGTRSFISCLSMIPFAPEELRKLAWLVAWISWLAWLVGSLLRFRRPVIAFERRNTSIDLSALWRMWWSPRRGPGSPTLGLPRFGEPWSNWNFWAPRNMRCTGANKLGRSLREANKFRKSFSLLIFAESCGAGPRIGHHVTPCYAQIPRWCINTK